MKFCDRCGSFMDKTPHGLRCTKCGYEQHPKVVEVKREENTSEPVYVVKGDDDATKVNQTCPKCGHNEAYHQVRVSLGEHAGVASDRFVERFRCASCGHVWMTN